MTKEKNMTKEQMLEEMTRMRESITRISESEARYKHAAETLRKSEAGYRELVELANSIILRLDTSGNIIFVNEFACDFFGYAKNELIGENIIGTIVPEVESSGRKLADFIGSVCQNPTKYAINENENIKKAEIRFGFCGQTGLSWMKKNEWPKSSASAMTSLKRRKRKRFCGKPMMRWNRRFGKEQRS